MENCNLDYPVYGNVTKEKVKMAQERILKLAVFVRDCFEANNIDYFIIYGSLLGAVRHKGFIPWDLDFDIFVPEEHYAKATEVISASLPEGMILQNRETDPFYCAQWAKVVDLGTSVHSTLFAGDNLFTYKGVHVDLYCLKRTSAVSYESDCLKDHLEYFTYKHSKGLLSDEIYNQKCIEIEDKLKIAKRDTLKDHYYFLHFLNVPADLFYPAADFEFEGEHFKGPGNPDYFLKLAYGQNYMEPPLFEKRDLKIDELNFI